MHPRRHEQDSPLLDLTADPGRQQVVHELADHVYGSNSHWMRVARQIDLVRSFCSDLFHIASGAPA